MIPIPDSGLRYVKLEFLVYQVVSIQCFQQTFVTSILSLSSCINSVFPDSHFVKHTLIRGP